MSKALIAALVERRGVLKTELDGLLEVPTQEKRNLNETEAASFDRVEKEIREIDDRVKQLDEQVTRDAAAGETARRIGIGGAQVVSEPEVYRKGATGQSYFRDLYYGTVKGDRDAADRLQRNNRMRADHAVKSGQEQRAISGTIGAGGELIPPLWLEDDFIKFVRPDSISAHLCTQGTVPPGTNSINIPKINTGTAVAVQNGQNTGVQQTDLTTTSVASPVITIAGGQTVSLQLIEQSPLNIDEVVLQDLAADYARYMNLQVLSGSGAAGQATGLLTLGGTQAVTYTQGPPASLGGAGGFYAKLANAVQLIQTTRFLSPTAIVMHPRRWAWVLSQSDSNNRPLVVPEAGGPWNVVGNQDQMAAQGIVGRMLALPVYIDALLPTNLGAGTNQDEVYVAKMDDLWLWQGQIRAEAFQQTFANNMSVFVRLYNYISFQPGRYPQSICTINGTGLVAPTF